MNRRSYLKLCAAALGDLALSPLSFAQSQEAQLHTATIHRQLRFTISLTNPYSEELPDQTLWLYIPAVETPTQKLGNLKVSMDYHLSSDVLGHGILKLSFPQVAPLATKIVTLIVDVALYSEPTRAPLLNVQEWLGSELYIETGDERIKLLAAELKRSTARDTSLAIYDWIKQHLQYAGYVADDLGALSALIQRRGDCTEYAYLAVALARANDIPARMVGGYVIDRNIEVWAEDYHNWAEVYFEGAWRLLDAQKEHWLTPTEQYVAFRYYRDKVINQIGLAHRYKMKGLMQVRF
ncbi:MAG TPA: transglutaminase domain-containing protein [Gallionella sp.]|nr:transglutaminase domain-containing protein [Gallionella sp.]